MTQKWETFDHKIMEMCDIFFYGNYFLFFQTYFFVLVFIFYFYSIGNHTYKFSENRHIIHILSSISSQRMLMHEYIIDDTHTRALFLVRAGCTGVG